MYVDRRGPAKHKASAHSDPVWMQESIFEARVTGRMVISKKKKKSKSLGRVIKSLILDLTDTKHLDISAITSGLEFGQK